MESKIIANPIAFFLKMNKYLLFLVLQGYSEDLKRWYREKCFVNSQKLWNSSKKCLPFHLPDPYFLSAHILFISCKWIDFQSVWNLFLGWLKIVLHFKLTLLWSFFIADLKLFLFMFCLLTALHWSKYSLLQNSELWAMSLCNY